MYKAIELYYGCGHFGHHAPVGEHEKGCSMDGDPCRPAKSDIIGTLNLRQDYICGECFETRKYKLYRQYTIAKKNFETTFDQELERLTSMNKYYNDIEMSEVEVISANPREDKSDLESDEAEIGKDYVIPPTLENDDSDAIVFLPTLDHLGTRTRIPLSPRTLEESVLPPMKS